MTHVTATSMPPGSRLSESFVPHAWFQDAYAAPLSVTHSTMPELFFAIFGHHPAWMKTMLIARNRVAARWGLRVPDDADILCPTMSTSYNVGDKIGPWPLFALHADELIAGRDNSHLDFRVSVMRTKSASGAKVTVTTVCNPHNAGGKAYLLAIAPFHKLGMRRLLANAVVAGRI